jgi:hypothetical protein
VFTIDRFGLEDASALAGFFNSASEDKRFPAFTVLREGADDDRAVTPTQLLEEHLQPNRIDTYLLRREGEIVSTLQIDDPDGERKIAVLSGIQMDSHSLRSGICRRFLNNRWLREICQKEYERLEVRAKLFDRQGISLGKRVGFRMLPGAFPHMENFLPLIIRHPALCGFFARNDFLRTLQSPQNNGHDSDMCCGRNLFTYHWRSGNRELRVRVDWELKQIVAIETENWHIWCFLRDETPHCIYYHLRNPKDGEMAYRVQGPTTRRSRLPLLRRLPGGRSQCGHFRLSDAEGRPLESMVVDFELDGISIPFTLSQHGEGGQVGGSAKWESRLAG